MVDRNINRGNRNGVFGMHTLAIHSLLCIL